MFRRFCPTRERRLPLQDFGSLRIVLLILHAYGGCFFLVLAKGSITSFQNPSRGRHLFRRCPAPLCEARAGLRCNVQVFSQGNSRRLFSIPPRAPTEHSVIGPYTPPFVRFVFRGRGGCERGPCVILSLAPLSSVLLFVSEQWRCFPSLFLVSLADWRGYRIGFWKAHLFRQVAIRDAAERSGAACWPCCA